MTQLSLPCLYCKTQHVLLCLTVYRYIYIWLWDTTYLSSAVQRQKRRRKMSPVRFIFISRVRILLCLVRNIQPQCITESSIIQTVSFSKLINSTQKVSNTFFLEMKLNSSGNGKIFLSLHCRLFEPPWRICDGVTRLRAWMTFYNENKNFVYQISTINIMQQYGWNTVIFNN